MSDVFRETRTEDQRFAESSRSGQNPCRRAWYFGAMEAKKSPVAGEPMSSDVARARSGLFVKAANGLRLRDKKTERLARRVRDSMPWLQPSDYPTVRAWAEMQILADQAYAILRYATVTNKQGEPRRLLDEYRRLRLAQHTLARDLGMTPLARLQLRATGRDAPLDLVAALAQANESEATEAEVAAEPESADGAKRGGKWNARGDGGRFKPANGVALDAPESIAEIDDGVSAESTKPDAPFVIDDDDAVF